MKKVEVKIKINTKPENVIKAFMDSSMLREWWGVEKCLIQPKINGLYTLSWMVSKDGMGYVSSGIIRNYDPKKEFLIDNFVYLSPDKPFLGPMTLAVVANKIDSYVEVYLCQDGYQEGDDWDWYYNAVKEAWPNVMQGFKKYLENLN